MHRRPGSLPGVLAACEVESARSVGAGAPQSRTFSFSGAHGARASKLDGLLHGGQRQELQQVVLDDVAGRADAVVVACAGADADVLGHRDLDVSRRSAAFHRGSNIALAKRIARMFWTVSLPR